VRQAYAAYNDTGGVVAPSEFGRRQLLELGIHPDKALVVRYPIRIPKRAPTRPEGPVRCLAVGRLELMKDTLLTVEAFRRASNSHPDLELDIVGDGSLRPQIEQAIQSADLGDRVRLHGYVEHSRVYQMMSKAHIFIHPSVTIKQRFDTCPNAVAEAAAHAMAIVATRHGGIPEQVENEESALLFDEHDVEGVTEGMLTLARDPDLRIQLGKAARDRAEEMFSPDVIRFRWLDLLDLES